jgi:hypothetical protein
MSIMFVFLVHINMKMCNFFGRQQMFLFIFFFVTGYINLYYLIISSN